MDKGWVKLHRQLIENPFLMRDVNAFNVFIKMLLMVGKTKGELAGGKYELAARFDLAPSTFYKTMLRLEKQGMVNRQANQRYTVWSICKWHNYQERAEPIREPAGNHTGTSGEHSNKKENKKKNKEATFLIPEQLEPEISEFVKMRKVKRNPPTEHAIELLVKKLNKWYPEDYEKQKLCLEKAIESGWATVYQLKQSDLTGTQKRFA